MLPVLLAAAVAAFPAAPAVSPVPAPAAKVAHHPASLCAKAYAARKAVIRRHGARAPGRNICRDGVQHSTGRVEPATTDQKARYVRALRALLVVKPFVAYTASLPRVPPAGTMTPHPAPTGQAACIVRVESGGDPQANNGSHFGIGQWDVRTWLAHGGGRYAPTPLGATYEEQLEVLTSALARFGCGAWCPWEPGHPCG